VKLGATRVDLDGNPCGELEEEHVEHAQAALAESKARVQARRKEQGQKAREEAKAKQPKAKKPQAQARRPQAKAPKSEKPVETRALNADEMITGKQVNVNMGKGNMAATIVEVNKEDVRVQLVNGLQMVVKAEHLRA
ncbi:RNA chaperone ProQ, partial [Vibrio sp. V17_P4S1T151]